MQAKGIQRESTLLAAGKAIRELGIVSFGDIMLTSVETRFRKPRTYRPRIQENPVQGPSKKDAFPAEPDYSVPFASGVMLAVTNLYAVRLKDGKEMNTVYIK